MFALASQTARLCRAGEREKLPAFLFFSSRRGDPPGARLWIRQRDGVPGPAGRRISLQAARRCDGEQRAGAAAARRGALSEKGPHSGGEVSAKKRPTMPT